MTRVGERRHDQRTGGACRVRNLGIHTLHTHLIAPNFDVVAFPLSFSRLEEAGSTIAERNGHFLLRYLAPLVRKVPPRAVAGPIVPPHVTWERRVNRGLLVAVETLGVPPRTLDAHLHHDGVRVVCAELIHRERLQVDSLVRRATKAEVFEYRGAGLLVGPTMYVTHSTSSYTRMLEKVMQHPTSAWILTG